MSKAIDEMQIKAMLISRFLAIRFSLISLRQSVAHEFIACAADKHNVAKDLSHIYYFRSLVVL